MSQHDFNIANQGFPSFRTDLNNALVALATTSSGTAAPATTYANQLWYETDTNTLHIRNEANSAWLDLMVIDQTTGSPSFTAGNVGIGTSSPAAALHVNSGLANLAGLFESTDSGATLTLIDDSTTGGSAAEHGLNTVGNELEVRAVSTLAFETAAEQRMVITSAGNVGIGTTIPSGILSLAMPTTTLTFGNIETDVAQIGNGSTADSIAFGRFADAGATFVEKARITSGGDFLVSKTGVALGTVGIEARAIGLLGATRSGGEPLVVNRLASDGALVTLQQDTTTEGTISVSGNTVTYGPFLGSHFGALADWSRPDIKIGTVMDTIDELLDYKVVVIDVQEEATTQTVQKRISYNGNGAIGSNATVEYQGQEYTGIIHNEREEPYSFNKHLKVKVNDTAGSKAVFGVFVSWGTDETNDGGVYNDMLVGAVGNYVIRMAAGQEPQIGDLVEAGGNGCAVVQDDDIIRTKTIAKITSTIKQATYDDGSFLVTCVLYCG